MKTLNFFLGIITVCLIYIAFLKPLPQRYILKETEETDLYMSTTRKSVFDTATGKLYEVSHAVLPKSVEQSKFSFEHITHNTVSDFINNSYIERSKPKKLSKE